MRVKTYQHQWTGHRAGVIWQTSPVICARVSFASDTCSSVAFPLPTESETPRPCPQTRGSYFRKMRESGSHFKLKIYKSLFVLKIYKIRAQIFISITTTNRRFHYCRCCCWWIAPGPRIHEGTKEMKLILPLFWVSTKLSTLSNKVLYTCKLLWFLHSVQISNMSWKQIISEKLLPNRFYVRRRKKPIRVRTILHL